MLITTCIRFWCLPACQKQTSSFTNFLIYYIVKNPAIWLADSILGNNLRPDVGFARWCGIGGGISIAILVFILDNFQEKLQRKFFKKSTKPTLGLFCPNLGKNEFPWKKKALSVFKYSNYYTELAWNSEKTNQSSLRKMLNWPMDIQTDGQIDRQQWFY